MIFMVENIYNSSNMYAIVCSIGDYNMRGISKLIESSINDRATFINSLKNGLCLNDAHIDNYANKTLISFNDFNDSLNKVPNSTEILIIYISSHGCISNSQYNILFSDQLKSFKDILESISRINVKTKLIFLDTCYSGSDLIEDFFPDLDYKFNESNNEQYLLFASCKNNECSYIHQDEHISKFTKCLSYAIDDNLNKNKIHSLYNIIFLTSLYAKKYCETNQHCMVRSNILGDIIFSYNKHILPIEIKNCEKNADDLKILQLIEIEKSLIKLYDCFKKRYLEYVSSEYNLEKFKTYLNPILKEVNKLVYWDLQQYKCDHFEQYQEKLDTLGQNIYDLLQTFIVFDFDEIYKNYRAKNNIVNNAILIEQLKKFRLKHINTF
jgi:hypothetical protein